MVKGANLLARPLFEINLCSPDINWRLQEVNHEQSGNDPHQRTYLFGAALE
jgi:hypothetical protein